MSSMYAMQRANGDWFAVSDDGRLHVPVFRSSGEAWRGHWRNAEMMLFKPVVLDERALKDPSVSSSAVQRLVKTEARPTPQIMDESW
ncbi:hypothetical protein BH20ACI3_BH20ACI3_19600 [soil metagenome]